MDIYIYIIIRLDADSLDELDKDDQTVTVLLLPEFDGWDKIAKRNRCFLGAGGLETFDGEEVVRM